MMPQLTLFVPCFFMLINLSADIIVIFLLLYSYDASIDTFHDLFFTLIK